MLLKERRALKAIYRLLQFIIQPNLSCVLGPALAENIFGVFAAGSARR